MASSLMWMTQKMALMTANMGVPYIAKYLAGTFIGPLSFGSRTIAQLLITAGQGEQHKFLELFQNANAKSARGPAPVAIFTKWNGSTFDIVNYVQCGFYASVYYVRTTPALQKFSGYFLADLEEWALTLTPRVANLYVTEQPLI